MRRNRDSRSDRTSYSPSKGRIYRPLTPVDRPDDVAMRYSDTEVRSPFVSSLENWRDAAANCSTVTTPSGRPA